MATSKTATTETPDVAGTSTQNVAVVTPQPLQRFEPAYDVKAIEPTNEGERTSGLDPVQQRIADSNVMFFNSPQNNDQWIGVAPLKEEDFPGVNLGTIRKVPLNPEAIGAGRKVRFPSGDTAVLPANITTPEGVLGFKHPETGEALVEEKKKK